MKTITCCWHINMWANAKYAQLNAAVLEKQQLQEKIITEMDNEK